MTETSIVTQQDTQLARPFATLATALQDDPEVNNLDTTLLAENALMSLGLGAWLDDVPPIEPDETITEYLIRAWDDISDEMQARIEVSGIQAFHSLSVAGEKAIQQRLYRQFQSGSWEVYAYGQGINRFRDYVYYVLREAHGLKDTKAGRWADSLYVVGWLYTGGAERYEIDWLPGTGSEYIHAHLNSLGRAAYRIIRLIAQSKQAGIQGTWDQLQQWREGGNFDPDNESDNSPGAILYRAIYEIRALLGKISEGAPSKEVDRSAAHSRPHIDPIYWPCEIPLTMDQRAYLESRLGDVIKFSDEGPGMHVRQYKMELLPCCQLCGEMCDINVRHRSPYCNDCDDEIEYQPVWSTRFEDDGEMTSWEPCEAPKLENWTPEMIEVAGITCYVYNTLEENGPILEVVGVDVAREGGDMTAIVSATVNDEDVVEIVDVRVFNGNGAFTWYDGDKKTTLEQKVHRAATEFKKKRNVSPRIVYVHGAHEGQVEFDDAMLPFEGAPNVLPNHFYVED